MSFFNFDLLPYSGWDYAFFLFTLIYLAPLIIGGMRLAEKICSGSFFERFVFVSLFTLISGGLIFGLCGTLHILTLFAVLAGNIAAGLLALLLAARLPAGKENYKAEFPSLRERCLTGLLAGWTVTRLFPVISMPAFGTDSYMYHLYYPAEWIRTGMISKVTIIGLFPEYYPVFGELLYGFLMLPQGGSPAVAGMLQWWSLVTACAAMVMLAETFGFRRNAGLLSGCILFMSGIIMMNLLMAYTDVLNGALCFAGFCFLVAACVRNSLPLFLFAGVVMGCSASVKPLGMMWTPVITLVMSLILRYIYRPDFRKILMMYGTACMTAFPFFIGNWIATGNPLYPQKISLFGKTLLGPGISAGAYAPIGLKNLPAFLFDGGIFGFNKATVILYVFLGAAGLILAAAAFFLKKKENLFPNENTGKFYLLFVPVILLFTMIHVMVYPRIAEPRSLILLLIFWAVFFFPLLQILAFRKYSFAFLIFAFLFFSSRTTNFITWGINWAGALTVMILFACFRNEKLLKRGALILLFLLLAVLPLQITLRGQAKQYFYQMTFNPEERKSCEVIRNTYLRGEKCVIDYVGGVFCYVYMEDMPGNRVLYVPISEKESAHVHDFGSYEAMRMEPVTYEVWRERLKRSGVNFLIVQTSSPALIFNREQEIKWAEAHPEEFARLIPAEPGNGQTFYMYQVHIKSE